MQEIEQKNHLKKVLKTDVSKTLMSFKRGETEFIPISESETTTQVFSSRYGYLRRQKLIETKMTFRTIVEPEKGTLITCY